MSNDATFKHMSTEQLHKVLPEDSHVVVDIRDENSFNANHIPHSIHLTNDSLSEFLRSADMDKPVVVCCYHGISSQQAAQFLVSQDFSEVYSLDGGFTEWEVKYPGDTER